LGSIQDTVRQIASVLADLICDLALAVTIDEPVASGNLTTNTPPEWKMAHL